MIKWVWSGGNVGEWSGGTEEKVCIGLNCEPWIRGGGGGKRTEKGRKRGELGYINSIFVFTALGQHYCGMVYENERSDWLTKQCRNNTHDMLHTRDTGTHASGLHDACATQSEYVGCSAWRSQQDCKGWQGKHERRRQLLTVADTFELLYAFAAGKQLHKLYWHLTQAVYTRIR